MQDIKLLLKSALLGFMFLTHRSSQRCVPIDAYKLKDVKIVGEGEWVTAPKDAVILGLKELPEADFPLEHTHVYFAHCFKVWHLFTLVHLQKGQDHAHQLLNRFQAGSGKLYDLEFLVDDSGRRVAAFGNAAGMVTKTQGGLTM